MINRCLLCLFFSLATMALAQAQKDKYLLYVGTYTEKESKGIYVYRVDPKSMKLEPLGLAAQTTNPSFLAADPKHRFLYTVNEVPKYKDASSGYVTAFSINRATGMLEALNEVPSKGADPCYISLDKTGKYVLVANYGGGSVAVFPVQPDGKLGDATAFIQHTGHGVNKERQEAPHAHWIETTPDNNFAIASDLGLDQLLIYRFDHTTGTLAPNNPPYAKLDPGAGPRHLAFHPNHKLAFVVNEMQNTITTFSYDMHKGELLKRTTVSTLPKDFKGENTTAEIQVHPNGKFLYASNRGHETLAAYTIDAKSGALTLIDYFPTQGKEPRSFTIDPTGKFLLVANQNSNTIIVFSIDQQTGKLTATSQKAEVSQPVSLQFVAD